MIKKRLLPLAVSLLLLALLIYKVDARSLWETLKAVDLTWFGIALVLFVPQTLVITWRWLVIAEPLAVLPYQEAARQILASNSLNLILPSKMGDLAKGVFLNRQGRCSLADGVQVVVFEKLLDLAALSLWMLAGWFLVPSFAWWVLGVLAVGLTVVGVVSVLYFVPRQKSMVAERLPAALAEKKIGRKIRTLLESGPRVAALVRGTGWRMPRIVGWSLLIWLLHLLQIYCFFRCAGATVSLFDVVARMPIAIFAGLLPLTLAGIGTRDWAIVAIFAAAPYAQPEATLAAVGLLVSLRYVVPAAMGLPFIGSYLAMGKEAAAVNKNG